MASTNTWSTGYAIEVGTEQSAIWGAGDQIDITGNAYFNSGWKAAATKAGASKYEQALGNHNFAVSGSVTADSAITFKQALNIASNGDISFYEDTGTTPKFFWDASAESLGIGTSSPSNLVELDAGSGTNAGMTIRMGTGNSGANDSFIGFENSAGTEVIRTRYDNPLTSYVISSDTSGDILSVTRSGNVGIGEAPSVWRSADRALVVGNGASQYGNYVSEGLGVTYGSGWYRDTSGNFKYTLTGYPAGRFDFNYTGANVFSWHQAAAGTAGNNISFSEAMRIDSSGNLLVGTTDSDLTNNSGTATGANLKSNGLISSATNSTSSLELNRLSSDGNIANFRRSGALVGSIGTNSGRFAIYGTDRGIRFTASELMPTNGSGTATNDILSVGHPDYQFKDLHLSGSIEIENGTGNVGVGKEALNSNTSNNNTAVGYQAMYSYQTGGDNVAFGTQAGYSLNGNGNSTFIGRSSGYETTGATNTFVGYNSGYAVSTGSKNTILGVYNGNQGGLDIRTSSNNIVLSDGDGNPRMHYNPTVNNGAWSIPHNGHTGTSRGSGTKIALSAGAVAYDAAFQITDNVANNVWYGLNNAQAYVMVNSNGVLLSSGGTSWSSASDERLKTVTGSYTTALNDVDQINPVKFTWKADSENIAQVGVTAQSVQSVVPEAIDTFKQEDDDTEYMSVRYTELIPIMIAALKEAKAKIETLEAKVTALENA